ncbi:hypothetical protein DFP72DRAFT_857819 [Ephemerocybe angulata]|uniref:C2H2-type domain-containing protein n=1 Tax=Ephemerocybe angulata TaxID=980116 RepID=A0A8H6HD43_9AGAR|nr:hypothetical protein DFP72DRAFT_857819 [Tulosesus angulatus]
MSQCAATAASPRHRRLPPIRIAGPALRCLPSFVIRANIISTPSVPVHSNTEGPDSRLQVAESSHIPVKHRYNEPTRDDQTSLEIAFYKGKIANLHARAERAERSQKRMKAQLTKEKELRKDTAVELEETRNELLDMEERLDTMNQTLKRYQAEAERYRGWWLNEYYSVKVLARLVPRPAELSVAIVLQWHTSAQKLERSGFRGTAVVELGPIRMGCQSAVPGTDGRDGEAGRRRQRRAPIWRPILAYVLAAAAKKNGRRRRQLRAAVDDDHLTPSTVGLNGLYTRQEKQKSVPWCCLPVSDDHDNPVGTSALGNGSLLLLGAPHSDFGRSRPSYRSAMTADYPASQLQDLDPGMPPSTRSSTRKKAKARLVELPEPVIEDEVLHGAQVDQNSPASDTQAITIPVYACELCGKNYKQSWRLDTHQRSCGTNKRTFSDLLEETKVHWEAKKRRRVELATVGSAPVADETPSGALQIVDLSTPTVTQSPSESGPPRSANPIVSNSNTVRMTITTIVLCRH